MQEFMQEDRVALRRRTVAVAGRMESQRAPIGGGQLHLAAEAHLGEHRQGREEGGMHPQS